MPNGFNVTQTSRKIERQCREQMVSAISLGVFWRFAPSTSEIMRSRNPSPGLMEMRILISSESTRVPPVTAPLRSPPLSRITGRFAGDGRFIHGGGAFDDIAVGGNDFPRARDHDITFAEVVGADILGLAALGEAMGDGFDAGAAQRFCLGLAPAFGDSFGEVGEEDGEPEPEGELGDETRSVWAVKIPTVVNTAPTIVTNMTGFLSIRRGSSFLKASPIAGPANFPVKQRWSFGSHRVCDKWQVTGDMKIKKVCPGA